MVILIFQLRRQSSRNIKKYSPSQEARVVQNQHLNPSVFDATAHTLMHVTTPLFLEVKSRAGTHLRLLWELTLQRI